LGEGSFGYGDRPFILQCAHFAFGKEFLHVLGSSGVPSMFKLNGKLTSLRQINKRNIAIALHGVVRNNVLLVQLPGFLLASLLPTPHYPPAPTTKSTYSTNSNKVIFL